MLGIDTNYSIKNAPDFWTLHHHCTEPPMGWSLKLNTVSLLNYAYTAFSNENKYRLNCARIVFSNQV
jgi:hypothetical protein